MNKRSQQGAALIMALLLVAIVATIATGIFYSQRVQIQSATLTETADQAYANSRYAVFWAKKQLNQLHLQRKQQKKLPIWPQQMPAAIFANGDVLTAQLTPANAKFNINDLAQPVSQYLNFFANLIQVVAPNINSKQAQQIALQTQRWLTPVSSQGQLTNPYAKTSPAYQAAHQKMTSSSELRLVAGVSQLLYLRLKPYLVALPATNTPIDVNAAPQTILAALLGKDMSAAESVLQYRETHKGFLNDGIFLGLRSVAPYVGKKDALSKLITTAEPTDYLLRSEIKHAKLRFHMYSILNFQATDKTVTVLRQGQSL